MSDRQKDDLHTNLDRGKTARSVFWSSAESGGLAFVSFVSLIIYTHLLSSTDFGLFATAVALIELLGVLVNMLFHDALIQRREITELHFDTAFVSTVFLSVVVMGGCVLFAPSFAALVHQPKAGLILSWLSLSFPCSGLSATIMARQRRDLDFRTLALRSLIGRIAGAIVGIVAAVLGAGLWSFVDQQVVTALVSSAVLWATCPTRPRLRFAMREFCQLAKFGAFSAGALFLSFSIKRGFIIFAGALLSAREAGLLNLSFRTIDVLWAIGATAASQIAMPLLANLQNDPSRLTRTYRTAISFTCTILYPCFVGLGFTAPYVVELLYGKQWLSSVPYVTALALLVVVQAPRLFMTPVLTAIGRPHAPLIGHVIQIIFILTAILIWGMPSLTWAIGIWVGSELISLPVLALLVQTLSGIKFEEQIRGILAPLGATMIMAVTVTVARMCLSGDLSALILLCSIVPLGFMAFTAGLWLVDRRLFLDFGGFALMTFRRRSGTVL